VAVPIASRGLADAHVLVEPRPAVCVAQQALRERLDDATIRESDDA
jgi:hypothetical protein